MAQFDVHWTTGRNTAGTPYFVVVQSARYDSRDRRVVILLVTLPPANDGDRNLTPEFNIEGHEVYLDALRVMNVDATVLGQHVRSLADDASSAKIINAI